MSNSGSQPDRSNAIREITTRYLGLTLSDLNIEALLIGKSISLGDLLQEHSLAEIGAALIRIDMLGQVSRNEGWCKPCPPGEIGCVPICIKLPNRPPQESVLEFRLHPDWLE